MPTKKTAAAPAAKKPAAKPAAKPVSHDHLELKSDIDSLKKEVAILKSALAASVVAHKESDLKLADALELLEAKVDENNQPESKDARYDELIKDIKKFHEYRDLRKLYRNNK